MDNQNHADPETARLLAELGGQAEAKSERQVLLDEAVALGLKVALNIGTNKLKALIGEAREAAAAPAAGAGPADGDAQARGVVAELSATTEADPTVTVVNRSGQMYSIVGVSFKPNENVTLTAAQLKNERLMQKIEHMIRLKVFFRVAAQ